MKRSLVLLCIGVIAALPLAAAAQTYPTKMIRIINPFPSGGTTEILGRIDQLRESAPVAQPPSAVPNDSHSRGRLCHTRHVVLTGGEFTIRKDSLEGK